MNSLFSIGYMRGAREANQTRFYMCFALAMFAVMGIAMAANLFTLFIFYEALTLATYPLVTHKGNAAARRAGRIYLGTLVGASVVLFLPGIIGVASVAGSTTFTPGGLLPGKTSAVIENVLLLLLVFGAAKAALIPLHGWLPAAMVAPAPVSAMLHAVAVVKAGVFTVLKVSAYIFGPELITALPAATWIFWIAAATIVIASLVALTKDDLKARLAWSTVGQLAYITSAAMLPLASGLVAGGLHMVVHAVAKITLFMCAGAIYVATGAAKVYRDGRSWGGACRSCSCASSWQRVGDRLAANGGHVVEIPAGDCIVRIRRMADGGRDDRVVTTDGRLPYARRVPRAVSIAGRPRAARFRTARRDAERATAAAM